MYNTAAGQCTSVGWWHPADGHPSGSCTALYCTVLCTALSLQQHPSSAQSSLASSRAADTAMVPASSSILLIPALIICVLCQPQVHCKHASGV